MRLPPILERELRWRARLAKTTWIRVGVVVTAIFGWLVPILLGRAAFDSGKFSMLSLSFFPMLLSAFCGVFTTADCISREKREGTLGLLLLTPLRPTEILVQKIVSTSAPFLSGLLSVLPLFALPVVLGGVSIADSIALMVLALATGLLSVSIGCFVSCIAPSLQVTVCGTFLLLVVFFGAPFGLDSLGLTSSILNRLNSWSPVYLYVHFFENTKATLPMTNALQLFGMAAVISTALVWGGAFWLLSFSRRRISLALQWGRFIEQQLTRGAAVLLLILALTLDDEYLLLSSGLVSANLAKLGVLLAFIRILGNKPWLETILTTPLNPMTFLAQEARRVTTQLAFLLTICFATQMVVYLRLSMHLREAAFVIMAFVLCDSVALALVGLWNGLKRRSPSHAISMSLTSVLLVPLGIASVCLGFGLRTETFAGALVLWGILGLFVDVLAAAQARWLLQNQLRVTAATGD